jgi:SAM-dependent methyltransferase
MTTRQEKILACIDPATQTGLEIGALDKPIVNVEMGKILYVDHASTEELKQKYANDPNVATEQIVHVTYVWGEKVLPELVSDKAPVDYVIASHVIEHVPDLIGWLKEIHAVLKPGGILSLAIPDKRYCFDYFRQPTQLAEVVEAYLQGSRKPTPRQIFDFTSSFAGWKNQFNWSPKDNVPVNEVTRSYSVTDAWNITHAVFIEQSYSDTHCWVFTPQSFFDLFRQVIELDLIDFRVARYYETEACEFIVSLEAMDLTQTRNERYQSQLASLPVISIKEMHQLEECEVEQSAELVKQQADLESLQARLEQLRGDKQRLRNRVQNLQTELENCRLEIEAMKTSKFWRLRDNWFRLKKALLR